MVKSQYFLPGVHSSQRLEGIQVFCGKSIAHSDVLKPVERNKTNLLFMTEEDNGGEKRTEKTRQYEL